MRIPDAYFSGGLGRRGADVAPAPRIENPTAALSNAVVNLSNAAGNLALQDMEIEGRKAERKRKADAEMARVGFESALSDAAREIRTDPNLPTGQHVDTFQKRSIQLRQNFLGQVPEGLRDSYAPAFDEHINRGREGFLNSIEHDQKKLEEEKQKSEALTALTMHENAVNEVVRQIKDDPAIPPEKYLDTFQERAAVLKEGLLQQVPQQYQYAFAPTFDEHINQGRGKLYGALEQKTRDDVKANIFATMDELEKSNRPRTEKLAILNEIPEETWHAAGMGADDRVKAIKGFAEKTAETDISATLNFILQKGTAGIKDLERFRESLNATDGDAAKLYPELDPKKRQAYVSGITEQIGVLNNRLREEANRQKTEARQIAQELVTEFKDKVGKGWMPNTADDIKFMQQVRQAAGLSPSLARQYNEAYGGMTSFASREKLRKNDPLGVAAAEKGVVVPPLNILDPASLPQQVATRMQMASALGVKAVLLGPEVEAFTEHLKTLSPADQVRYVSGTAKAFGPLAPATLDMAAEQTRQSAPQASMLFKLVANGKTNEARQYADGLAVINDERKGYLKEKIGRINTEVSEGINNYLGTALLTMPGTRDALKNAVAVAYVGAATQHNVSFDDIDTDLLRQVMRGIVGDTVTTGKKWVWQGGSSKTTVVPDGMSPDTFLNSIRSIAPKDITDRGGVAGMTDDEAADWLKRTAWHETAGGYVFYKDHKPLYRKDGTVFTFSFER